MLCYMHGLVGMMQPGDFCNSSDVRLAVSRVITWTTEPKSVEVRKVLKLHFTLPVLVDHLLCVVHEYIINVLMTVIIFTRHRID